MMDRAAETMRCKLRQKGKDNRNMARENILQGIYIIGYSCRYQSRGDRGDGHVRVSVSVMAACCLLPCEPRHHLHQPPGQLRAPTARPRPAPADEIITESPRDLNKMTDDRSKGRTRRFSYFRGLHSCHMCLRQKISIICRD